MAGEPTGLAAGLRAQIIERVTPEMTASRVGSGDVDVLATPMVLAMVERAAVAAVSEVLPRDRTSVGTAASLEHVAPTPPGVDVTASVRLASVEGRTLSFEFEVADPSGVVARGTHVRVIVDRDRFLDSARARRSG